MLMTLAHQTRGLPAARFEDLLDRLIKHPGVQHAVLAVESVDGAVRWAGAAGVADTDGPPMSPETPYFIASIDKLCIAVAVLRAVEEGLMGLDDSVADLLPGPFADRIHVIDGEDRSAQITVKHLLGHTSGLPDYLEDSRRSGRSLVEEIVDSGEDRSFTAGEALGIVRDELTPHFPPQDLRATRPKVRYCDTNYQLLIELVEQVRSKPLHAVFAEEIFAPAEMRHTFFPGMSQPLEPVVPSAALRFGDVTLQLPRFLMSLNSIHSTAADQVALLRALWQGRLFRDPASLELMRGEWKRFGFPRDKAALRAPSWPIEYGHGMVRFAMPPPFTGFRRLPAVVGHTGSTGSWLFICPELDVVFAGTVDQATAGALPFRSVVPRLLRAVMDG